VIRVVKMMKKEKPMMSVTAIIQGAQNWSRSLSNFGPSHMSLGTSRANFSSLRIRYSLPGPRPVSQFLLKIIVKDAPSKDVHI
jgi:hypothetical protein